MPVLQKPPLNGRNLAEFYLSSETVKRTTLLAYAKPAKEQKARALMYDPSVALCMSILGADVRLPYSTGAPKRWRASSSTIRASTRSGTHQPQCSGALARLSNTGNVSRHSRCASIGHRRQAQHYLYCGLLWSLPSRRS